jgi:triacylglycerol lipase
MMPNGKIKSASQPDLCLTLANERKYAGAESWMTPVYHWRAVTLENCADNSHALQQLRWGHPAEQDKNYADSLGRNMPSEIASAISNLGNQLGTIAPTTELYKGQHRVYELGELEVAKDIAYGPHERHKLDVHTDKYRRSNSAMPVVVFFHGGGFVRGNRANSRNFVDYFASLGLVGVNATYRLAPEVKWPAGAEDVGKVITWVKENISEYGGDPDSIIVVGKSAGAAHVATYLFRPGVLEAPTATAAGAVLISGVYDLNSEQASEGSLAYYGKDLSKHPFMSVAGNIERSDIPVLLSISEYDPPNFKTAMTKLMHELTIEHERMPRVVQLLGHNHYSSNMAVGTQDTMLSAEVLELIHRVSRDNKQD